MADEHEDIPAFLRRDMTTDPAHKRRIEREKRARESRVNASGVTLAPVTKKDEKKKPAAVRESRADLVRRVLDEVSRAKLNRYVKNASSEMYRRGRDHTDSVHQAFDANRREGGIGVKPEHRHALERHARKTDRREKFIYKAVDRLAKEDVIDEVSKKTLGRYVRRAAVDMHYLGGQGEKAIAKSAKRAIGIGKATARLTKEDANVIDEGVLADARTAAEHHFAMYKYHHHMGTHAERQAMHHMGTKHEDTWQAKAERHYKKADHHDRKMNAAHDVLTNAERYDESVDEGTSVYARRIDSADDLAEGSGRPRKSGAQAEDPDDHPIVQLKKSIALRGQHMFKFKQGGTARVSPDDAHRALDKYSSIRHPGERVDFANRIGHSHKEFRNVVRECVEQIDDGSKGEVRKDHARLNKRKGDE